MKNYKNIFIGAILVLLLLITTAATWIYSQVDSSLPLLDGKVTLFGLKGPVQVDRDEQGIPTISGGSRSDIAVAMGFVHAQERFFQMDLLRRNSAGELASLFGEMALDYDKSIRVHRFRNRAREILAQLPVEQKNVLEAYTRGVNQGLKRLMAKPFEYLILQQEPVEWQEEDTVLTVLSMYMDLQYSRGQRERSLGLMKDVLGDDVYAFLNPKGSVWDAAIDDTQYAPSPMPTRPWPSASSEQTLSMNGVTQNKALEIDYNSEQFPGSNNWSVGGKISTTGSAIVANDMHLGIRVPNTWFRASLKYKHKQQDVFVTGVSLPGTPNIIAGSNTNIAWGFTNSYGDWSDIVLLKTNKDGTQYLTPEGYKNFINNKQMIAVKGQEATEFTVKETIWGPVIGKNHKGELLALRWVAHDLEAVNLVIQELETAKNVDEAFNVASRSGIPAQNMMVGDSQGNIGWTITGPIPNKYGDVGDTPTDWSDGKNGWNGYLDSAEYPVVKNPNHARLWTANSRVVGDEMLAKIGNGGYALGARSSQIRDDLFAKETFSEKDLLAIALDDNAKFLIPWQQFLNDSVLTSEALNRHPTWSEVKSLVSEPNLKASVESVGYRIIRNFRLAVRTKVFEQLSQTLKELDEGFDPHTIRHQIETPLWQMVNEQPDNYLWLGEDNWKTLLESSLTQTLTDMTQGQALTDATWGQQNTTNIQHPLSKAVPFIGRWLDMPKTQLAGDSYIPRVQGTSFGASERMIVSPGHEESGILHMPTSQAGHPWSPYYGKGHSDWEQGKASPFLPGETKYTLSLLSY